jgi:hypothetical protein
MKYQRNIARPIERRNSIERRRAELTCRPLRLAFVIREDLSLEQLLRIIAFNTSLWGGYYNCLIPTNGTTIAPEWWYSLECYQPDKIIFCGKNQQNTIAPDLIEYIQKELLPFSYYLVDDWDTTKDIFNLEMERHVDSVAFAMPTVVPLQHILNSLKHPIEEEKSNVRIPKIDSRHPLSLLVGIQVGVLSDFYNKVFLEGFKAKEVIFESSNLDDYLTGLAEFAEHVSPIELTRQYLRVKMRFGQSYERPEGLSIVLVGKNPIKDLCAFWNLRLAESFLRRDFVEFCLPYYLLRNAKNFRSLCHHLKQEPWNRQKINIISTSLDKRTLRKFTARLKSAMGGGYNPRIINRHIPIAVFNTYANQVTDETSINGGQFSFRSPKPEFADLANGGEWAIDIRFIRPIEYPHFSNLNHWLAGKPNDRDLEWSHGYWIRYTDEKFVHRSNLKTSFITGQFTSDEDGFGEVFHEKGFETRVTEKNAYIEGFLRLLGDLASLKDEKIRDFLWRLQKKDAYNYADLKAELKKGNESDDLIDGFVKRRLLIRGMEFRCPDCGLLQFHPINILAEEMQCAGCLKLIQPPSNAAIQFRLNELACHAVQQGSIPVGLTHKFFQTLSVNRTLRLFGLEVFKDDLNMEIDYITTYRGEIILVESKDFKKGILPKEKRSALTQLTRLVKLANQIHSPTVIMSTLLPTTSPDFTDMVGKALNLSKNTGIATHILSLSAMGLVDLEQPSKILEHPDLFYNYR